MGIFDKYNIEDLANLAFLGEISFTNTEQEELIDNLREIIIDNEKISSLEDRTIMILALICIVRKWQGSELNFWQYILMKLDVRINPTKVFYSAISEYLSSQNRVLYHTSENKSSYYSTLLAQSLGPKESMYVLFDLLYTIYEESLLRDYKPGDVVFRNIAINLKSKLHNDIQNTSDIDFNVGSTMYKFKSSIRMLIDQDTDNFAKLIDKIMSIFSDNETSEQSSYLRILLREWYENNKDRIRASSTKRSYQLDIDSWKPKFSIDNYKLKIEVPNLRISNYSTFKNYKYKLFVNESITSGALLVGGNELLRYIKNFDIEVDYGKFTSNKDIKVNIQFFADDRKFFDSQETLYRKFILFNGNKETFRDVLEPKSYTIFTTYEDEINDLNVDYNSKYFYSLYIDSNTYFAFKGSILVSSETKEENKLGFNTYIIGDKIINLKYCNYGSDQEIDIFRSFPDLKFKCANVNDKKIVINIIQSFDIEENREYSYEFIVSESNSIFEVSNYVENKPSILKISIIDIVTGIRLSVLNFYVKKFSFGNENKIVYGSDAAINFKETKYRFLTDEQLFKIPYKNGELYFRPNYLMWSFLEYKNQNKLFYGYFWHSDIPINSYLKIETNFKRHLFIKFGSRRLEVDNNLINMTYLLNSISEDDRLNDKLYACLEIDGIDYRLFEVRLNEKFEGNPYIQLTEFGLMYDFSQVYIGSKNSQFRLELVSNEDIFSFDIGISGNLSNIDIKDGNYTINIYKQSDDVFDINEKHIYSGELIIGDPLKFYFENTKIKLKKCILNTAKNERYRIDNHTIVLDKSEQNSELGFPLYKGVLVNDRRKDDVVVEVYNKAKISIKKLKSNNSIKFNFNTKTKSLSLESTNNKEVFEIDNIYFEIDKEY